MTAGDPIAAAIANRQRTLAQLDALRPLVKPAQAKASELQDGVKHVRTAGERARKVKELQNWVPGFFPTPPAIVRRMIMAAGITATGQRYGDAYNPATPAPLRILEPSAGKGDIAKACAALGHMVYCVELVSALCQILQADGRMVQQADFLTLSLRDFSFAEGVGGFDLVMMNPPFEHGQDIEHIKHARQFLKKDGFIVALCAAGPRQHAELQPLADYWEILPAGSFKASGTGVSVALLMMRQ